MSVMRIIAASKLAAVGLVLAPPALKGVVRMIATNVLRTGAMKVNAVSTRAISGKVPALPALISMRMGTSFVRLKIRLHWMFAPKIIVVSIFAAIGTENVMPLLGMKSAMTTTFTIVAKEGATKMSVVRKVAGEE